MATPIQDAVQAELIASSIHPNGRDRIDTLKVRYPRMVHADFLTHRKKSRNGSSSRAMPSVTLLKDDPYVPTFRHNKAGMQPGDHLSPDQQAEAEAIWLRAAQVCQEAAAELAAKDGLNVHKQWTNRMLEWFGYITVVVSATNWTNYLALRDHPDAQDEIIWQAQAVRDALAGAQPRELGWNDWHLPFIREEDLEDTARAVKDRPGEVQAILHDADFAFPLLKPSTSIAQRLLLIQSSARCARTSYRNFDGSKMTLDKDASTFLKLGSRPIHASPFEHQARPALIGSAEAQARCGNFDQGWAQFRKFIPDECL